MMRRIRVVSLLALPLALSGVQALASEVSPYAGQEARDIKALFARMEAAAKELGAELVAAERVLDEMFRDKTIDESLLSELVAEIVDVESRLRAIHLSAHLHQIDLLSEHQVERYMSLRGYTDDEDGSQQQHQQHHHGG